MSKAPRKYHPHQVSAKSEGVRLPDPTGTRYVTNWDECAEVGESIYQHIEREYRATQGEAQKFREQYQQVSYPKMSTPAPPIPQIFAPKALSEYADSELIGRGFAAVKLPPPRDAVGDDT